MIAKKLMPAMGQSRPDSSTHSNLLRAREMPDFPLGTRWTDIRGWLVYTNDAVLVGSVASLFVDMHARVVRYLGVSLSDDRSRPPREVLVPVGSASRPDGRQIVLLNGLSYAQLKRAPRVAGRPVVRADETATLSVLGMAPSRDPSANDLYAGPNFDEDRLFGLRGTRSDVPE